MSKIPKISFPNVNLNLKEAGKLTREINLKLSKPIPQKGYGPFHDPGMDNVVNGRTHGGRGFIKVTL